MEKAYKYRIYPNKTQQLLIQKTFGCVRFIYNHFLTEQMELYKQESGHLTYVQMSKELTSFKKDNEWLKEVDAVALQSSIKDLDQAYKNYFDKMSKPNYIRYSSELLAHLSRIDKKPILYNSDGHPKFKKKKNHHKSYRTKNNNNAIEFNNKKIKLPKLGWLRTRDKQVPQGRILNATISQEPSGKYYVSICCTDVIIKPFPNTGKKVGIDLGIKEFAITSDGIKYPNPKYLKKSLTKLKKLQKELSRKQIGSSNWNKNRIKVARLQEHITNQRKNFLRQLSTELIRENDIICIEDLQIKNMMQNHKLAQSISDVSWYEFTRQLSYKAVWYGREIRKVDRWFASSQTCSCCGQKFDITKDLGIREWTCPNCNTTLDRDINAAINILHEGMKIKNK